MRVNHKIIKATICLAAVIVLIFIVYALLYISWNNRVTYISRHYITNESRWEFFDTDIVKLKRKEVRQYFYDLELKTGQDSMVSIGHELPSERFDFFRELKNQLILYSMTAIRYQEPLAVPNADVYMIDILGVALYLEFFAAFYPDNIDPMSSDLMVTSPFYQEFYKHFKTKEFYTEHSLLDIKSLNRPFGSGFLSFPMIIDKQDNVYINMHYLHGNKIFPGTYDWIYSNIRYNDKVMVFDDEISVVTFYNDDSVISKYKAYKLGKQQYINVDVIPDLYGYKIEKKLTAGYSDGYGWWGGPDNLLLKISHSIKPFNEILENHSNAGVYFHYDIKIDDTIAGKEETK